MLMFSLAFCMPSSISGQVNVVEKLSDTVGTYNAAGREVIPFFFRLCEVYLIVLPGYES